MIDAIATVKGNRLVFNLRRFTNDKTRETETLYAILSEMNSAYCSRGRGGIRIYNAPQDFKIAPDHHHILDLPSDFKQHEPGYAHGLACVYQSDGNKYLFIELFTRTKSKGDEGWRY